MITIVKLNDYQHTRAKCEISSIFLADIVICGWSGLALIKRKFQSPGSNPFPLTSELTRIHINYKEKVHEKGEYRISRVVTSPTARRSARQTR